MTLVALRSAPTMFLSECVLVYMEPAESADVIRWTASRFACACFVTYEQVSLRPQAL